MNASNNSDNEEENIEQNEKSKRLSPCGMKLLIIVPVTTIIVTFVILFVFIPFIFRLSPTVQRSTVFMNFVNLQFNYNVSNPLDYGLNCSKSFFIQSDNLKIGVWHILPYEDKCSDENFEFSSEQSQVVLYAHGNGGTRGGFHRIGLYKKLSNELGYHVITFDYRGYGDSEGVPSLHGVTNDTNNVYQWLLNKGVLSKNILIWGHSLGTSISSEFLSQTSVNIPIGTVLEAPFTSMQDEIRTYPLSKLFRWLPYFDYCFVEPIVTNPELNFNTSATLNKIETPLLILHAEDDRIIPFFIGKRLYEQALQLQPKNIQRAQFVSFPANLNYGHKTIFKDPELSKIIRKFHDSLRTNE